MRDISSYAREYQAAPFEPVQAAVRRRTVLAQVARFSPASLLEVGCGNLPLLADLPHVACDVVEPATVFADAAQRHAKDHAEATVHCCGIEDFGAARPGGYDMVVVSGVLHEVDDALGVLAALRPLCHASSVVHVNVPNARSIHRLLGVAMGAIADMHELSQTQRRLQQRTVFDVASLSTLMVSAGFDVMDVGSLFIKPFTHAQMQELMDTGFMDEAMLEGLCRLVEYFPEHGSEVYVNARLTVG
ncbi:MAG: class I SAM-dependent methyltransferase [Burkholderiales bacterium]